jgi:RHS repeat-associated protein
MPVSRAWIADDGGKAMRTLLLLVALSLFSCFVGFSGAQVSPGVPSFSAFDSHEIDAVNLMSNNILLNVPVMSKSGAFPLRYSLAANFYMFNNSGTWAINGVSGSPFSQSIYGFGGGGLILFDNYSITFGVLCPDGHTLTNKLTNWYVQTADGTFHYLPPTDYIDDGGCLNRSFTDSAADNSGITLAVDYSYTCCGYVKGIYDRSGNRLGTIGVSLQANVTDTNGNSIQSASTGGGNPTVTYTDTLGLQALTVATSFSAKTITSSWTDVNNRSPQVTVAPSGSAIWRTTFGCTGINELGGNSQPTQTTIDFPDTTSIGITYEGTPGYSGDYTGRIGQITLREGGTITYSYGGGHNGIDCTYQTVPVLTRQTSDGTTTYTLAHSLISGSNYEATNTVVDNGGNATVYTFTGFTSTGVAALPTGQVVTQVQRYQGSVSPSNLLTTDVYCYNTVFSSCSFSAAPTATVTLPITKLVVLHKINGMSNTSASETHYDKYGNVTYSAQYTFGGTSPARATTTTYGTWGGSACSSIGSNINDKPCDVVTTQGSSTVAEERYAYDSHGNVLKPYVWNGSSFLGNTTANSYNSNGTLATSYDLANNENTYTYSSSGYTGCSGTPSCSQYPFPTTTTNVATGLSTQATWNGVGGVKLTDVDANGNTTWYCTTTGCLFNGSPDPFWRPLGVIDPLNNFLLITYPSGSAPDTINSSFTFNSGNSILNPTKTLDAYGRDVNMQAQQGPSSSNYDTVSTQYGWSSHYRTIASSQPCTASAGGACTAVHTNYLDPLGRLYQETTTSNETLTHTYAQNDDLAVLGPAPSFDGENAKQVQKEYDGLGRLMKSCAIGNGSSTACGQNTGSLNGVTDAYTYSQGTGYTTVTIQRGGLGSQLHSKTYDALGRVTQSVTPEGGTWNYVYDSNTSCPSGFQGAAGKLASSKDPNLNLICYAYDSLGRVTGVNANGTTCRHFYYDNSTGYSGSIPSGVTTPANPYGRMIEAATDTCSSGTLQTDLWFSYDKDGRTTDLWEKTPNSGTYYHSVATFFENGVVKTVQIANPSQYTQTYAIDGKGRWSSMSSSASGGVTVVSSATYNAASQPTNIAIGTSTDYDGYTYDLNTGRITGWTFQVGTSPKTQTGALTWNPIGTLKSLAITDGFYTGATQTCNFGASSNMGYDDWNRLLYDDCGSGGWGQTFSYDQYNNLTKAVISGRTGTTFNPGYNSANNEFASGFGASYDSNGNLTYDTYHHYEWNEFSKVKDFDRSGTNCATSGECLVYDALGRLVEIDGGSTKTEILYTQLGKTGYLNGTTLNYAYWPTPGGGTLLQAGGVFTYEHKDWLGSARIASGVLSDNIVDDRAFSPYGEIYLTFGSTAQNENMFTGDTQDIVSGTYDSPNRELNIVGRWISPDPAGAGWNQYAYAANPNSFTDPSGLAIKDCTWTGGCATPCDAYCSGSGGGGGGDIGGQQSISFTGVLWDNEQENENGYVANVYGPTIHYSFTGGDGSVYEQQKELAAITLGQLLAAQQDLTDPDDVADIIQQVYDTLTPVLDQYGNVVPQGGNYNFNYSGIVVNGEPVNVQALQCFANRCGELDSLDYSHSDGFHVDTANPWIFPIGTLLHGIVDLLGGNSWWKSGGIPRTP